MTSSLSYQRFFCVNWIIKKSVFLCVLCFFVEFGCSSKQRFAHIRSYTCIQIQKLNTPYNICNDERCVCSVCIVRSIAFDLYVLNKQQQYCMLCKLEQIELKLFDLDECQLKVDQDMFDLELGEFKSKTRV